MMTYDDAVAPSPLMLQSVRSPSATGRSQRRRTMKASRRAAALALAATAVVGSGVVAQSPAAVDLGPGHRRSHRAHDRLAGPGRHRPHHGQAHGRHRHLEAAVRGQASRHRPQDRQHPIRGGRRRLRTEDGVDGPGQRGLRVRDAGVVRLCPPRSAPGPRCADGRGPDVPGCLGGQLPGELQGLDAGQPIGHHLPARLHRPPSDPLRRQVVRGLGR